MALFSMQNFLWDSVIPVNEHSHDMITPIGIKYIDKILVGARPIIPKSYKKGNYTGRVLIGYKPSDEPRFILVRADDLSAAMSTCVRKKEKIHKDGTVYHKEEIFRGFPELAYYICNGRLEDNNLLSHKLTLMVHATKYCGKQAVYSKAGSFDKLVFFGKLDNAKHFNVDFFVDEINRVIHDCGWQGNLSAILRAGNHLEFSLCFEPCSVKMNRGEYYLFQKSIVNSLNQLQESLKCSFTIASETARLLVPGTYYGKNHSTAMVEYLDSEIPDASNRPTLKGMTKTHGYSSKDVAKAKEEYEYNERKQGIYNIVPQYDECMQIKLSAECKHFEKWAVSSGKKFTDYELGGIMICVTTLTCAEKNSFCGQIIFGVCIKKCKDIQQKMLEAGTIKKLLPDSRIKTLVSSAQYMPRAVSPDAMGKMLHLSPLELCELKKSIEAVNSKVGEAYFRMQKKRVQNRTRKMEYRLRNGTTLLLRKYCVEMRNQGMSSEEISDALNSKFHANYSSEFITRHINKWDEDLCAFNASEQQKKEEKNCQKKEKEPKKTSAPKMLGEKKLSELNLIEMHDDKKAYTGNSETKININSRSYPGSSFKENRNIPDDLFQKYISEKLIPEEKYQFSQVYVPLLTQMDNFVSYITPKLINNISTNIVLGKISVDFCDSDNTFQAILSALLFWLTEVYPAVADAANTIYAVRKNITPEESDYLKKGLFNWDFPLPSLLKNGLYYIRKALARNNIFVSNEIMEKWSKFIFFCRCPWDMDGIIQHIVLTAVHLAKTSALGITPVMDTVQYGVNFTLEDIEFKTSNYVQKLCISQLMDAVKVSTLLKDIIASGDYAVKADNNCKGKTTMLPQKTFHSSK